MVPAVEIGPVVIPTAGLVYILGVWLALSVVERAAKTSQQDVQTMYSLAVTMLGFGLVGARLLFVGLHWSAYQQNLVGIVWPLTTGFELSGGLLAGALAGLFWGRAKNLAPAGTLNSLLPGLITGLMVVSLADFLAGPGYGAETTMPWGITQFAIRRHPVQLYEIGVGLLALGGWWFMAKIEPMVPGRTFLATLILYSAGRLFVDAFRGNPWLTTNGYHLVQIISLITLTIVLFLFARFIPETADQNP